MNESPDARPCKHGHANCSLVEGGHCSDELSRQHEIEDDRDRFEEPELSPEAVAQASGAASKALIMFSKDELLRDPVVARVNENTCIACWYCLDEPPSTMGVAGTEHANDTGGTC